MWGQMDGALWLSMVGHFKWTLHFIHLSDWMQNAPSIADWNNKALNNNAMSKNTARIKFIQSDIHVTNV